MTNAILCATDFSESSKEALKWSIRLATELGAHLTVLYTYRLFKHNGEVIQMKKKIEEDAHTNFALLEKELLAGTGIAYDFKSEVGFVADRVEEHARKNPIGFLVVNKGMTTANRETFDELISHLQVPLVIVP
jgi:nucleotide-binding universal stress UspA family protein